MPKKQPRNAFYFYMLDFKEEQRKKGIQYANMQEVAKAAGPLWPQAPPSVRAKFEAMAKAEKAKRNIPEQKFTSTGVPLAFIEQQERQRREAEEAERHDIKNFVKLKTFSGVSGLADEDMYLMDVNWYCRVGEEGEYLVGEATALRFSLRDGIKDHYHELINPGRIPVGYASDVRAGALELGLPLPDEGEGAAPRTNYMQLLANLVDYLTPKAAPGPGPGPAAGQPARRLPPLYTVPEKVPPVLDFIHQLCRRAGEDDALFRVYRLDTLFFHLVNAVKSRADEGLPRESLALMQIEKDPFKYTPRLACEMHEEGDTGVQCSTSRVKRWAFTVLDLCCPLAGLPALPGRHLPADYDVERIVAYKEQAARARGERGAGGVRAALDGSLGGASSLDETAISLDTSAAPAAPGSKKESRANPSLRMPKTDYSQSIRHAPALTPDEFPSLASSRGLGRGRGLAGSFNKMSLNK